MPEDEVLEECDWCAGSGVEPFPLLGEGERCHRCGGTCLQPKAVEE
jgi:hypothetical protein